MSRRIWILAGAGGLLVAAVLGALLLGRNDRPAEATVALDLPAAGETRADYLSDGTPVWVARHNDGSVDVFSAFSTHLRVEAPRLTWWCPTSRSFEDPFSVSAWNEDGVKLGGPAPYDLSGWSATMEAGKVLLGDRTSGPVGGVGSSRIECRVGDPVTVHGFEGWRRWDSPREAIAGKPEGWILLAGGMVTQNDGTLAICSLAGCEDSATVGGIGPPLASLSSSGYADRLFIARVHNGQLTDLTRILTPPGT
ncbi:MAG: hypothetical protein ABJB65_03890 [Chloroflexota bacterium]